MRRREDNLRERCTGSLRSLGWRTALEQATRGMQCGSASRSFPQLPHARWVHEHVEAEAAAQEAAAAAQEAAAAAAAATAAAAASQSTWRLRVPVCWNAQNGPLGRWERDEVMLLRRALQNWELYDADQKARVEALLWRKFNSIMMPVGALAHLWTNTQSMELHVISDDEFEAESEDKRFNVNFDMTYVYMENAVFITYSGPVRFRRRPGMLNQQALEMLPSPTLPPL